MSEFDEFFAEQMKDPVVAVAYHARKAQMDKAIVQSCSEGCCTEYIDAVTGENLGGVGPVDCPCQDESEATV